MDGGGTGSAPFTEIESNGSVALQRDATGRLYVGGTAVITGSLHVRVDSFAAYNIVAAEADGEGNKLLLQRKADNALHAWTLDASWVRTGGGGTFAPGTSDFSELVALFELE